MRGFGQATVLQNCKCVKCRKPIEKNDYGYFIYEDEMRKKKIAGPFCSKECAPDVEGEEIEKLEKGTSGAVIPLRILATLWYLTGGFFGGIYGFFFNNAENIHGGLLGKLCAFIFFEKHSYLKVWNFNYK